MSVRLGPGAVLALTARECGQIALCRKAILDHWLVQGGVPSSLLALLDECEAVAREARARVRADAGGSTKGGSVEVPPLVVSADELGASYLNTAQAAKRLGVSTRRVRELLARNRLSGCQQDGCSAWAITVESVEARLERYGARKDGAA